MNHYDPNKQLDWENKRNQLYTMYEHKNAKQISDEVEKIEESTEDDTFKSGKSVRRILRNSWLTYQGQTSVGDDDLAYIDLLDATNDNTDRELVIINDVIRISYCSKIWLNLIV